MFERNTLSKFVYFAMPVVFLILNDNDEHRNVSHTFDMTNNEIH